MPFDYLFQVALIGDSSVGKSALMKRIAHNTFDEGGTTTLGVDFCMRTVKLEGGKVAKVKICDTAGQERFRALTRTFYKRADAIMLVYDITDKESFENLTTWIRDVHEHAPQSVQVVIVGNKADLSNSRAIPRADAKYFAAELGLSAVELSAKSSKNVEETFLTIVKEIARKAERDEELVRKSDREKLVRRSEPAKKRDKVYAPSEMILLGEKTGKSTSSSCCY
ncbi:Ras-related protein Rab [Seminavis robusta]|uniref:Ras-related protein Rab n=1 Tax=Seminavis robusta TaxID=568900 RepID=A0A9N8DFD1_9STRA|nr:Ras-related protein Rab [Seminavis robusta]|eukprot:Sro130_g062050.1 Ras-related protein Rab (224) ;mRNA; f:95405-96198